MALKEHQLYKELWANVFASLEPQIDEALEQVHKSPSFDEFLSMLSSPFSLSPRQRYECSSWYWCNRIVDRFEELAKIRTMTGRSLYKRRNEEKSVLLQEWIMYNYEHYTVVFQGILDVALLLTNEIFLLGNPYKECHFGRVCGNTRIKGTTVHSMLQKLNETTRGRREGKNLLVHRGERIKLPLETRIYDTVDVINLFTKLRLEVDELTRGLVSEFLSEYSRNDLIGIMEKECAELESQVEGLFTALLPYYRAFRSAYV